MKKNSSLYNDEINLIALFKIIWDGKIKILLITIISLLVGFGYDYKIPKNYLISLSVDKSNDSRLIQLEYIRKILKRPIPSDKLIYIDKFIYELKDYEEFLFNLKKTKKVEDYISKFKIEDQEKKLFKYARLLKIVAPVEDEENYIINFIWHDPEEAKKILQDTLNLTSKNLNENFNNELKQYLESEKKLILNKDRNRLNYLNEQSSIAKELNIVNNQLDNSNLSQSTVSLSINTADIAYYLRGYKAIDKEIELIKNRAYPNFKFVEQEINEIKNMEIKFIDYNIYLMQIKSLKKPKKLILQISILSGMIVGLFFVFISNVFQSQTTSKKIKNFNKS